MTPPSEPKCPLCGGDHTRLRPTDGEGMTPPSEPKCARCGHDKNESRRRRLRGI